jgi:FkbM family methyltransferase
MSDIFKTKWGIIEMPSNEAYISMPFKQGSYWDINTLLKLEAYIPKYKNILEIGGHVGTSTVVYASFLNKDSKYWVFEPQTKMFSYLQKNIKHNNLENVKAINGSAFCYTGRMNMNSTPLDGPNTNLTLNFLTESNMEVNYGGLTVGKNGEEINCYKLDEYSELDNIGFIHCDAQGSESFIFYGAQELVRKNRPVILYEDKFLGTAPKLYANVCKSYPEYLQYSRFDISEFCLKKLGYRQIIRRFNNSGDNLLIP